MKLVTDIKEANNLLQSYVGATLQIAFYRESLRRMAIRIMRRNVDEIIYLVGVGCQSISGRFSFSNVNLSITLDVDKVTNENLTVISDEASEFKLITSGGFALAQGVESDFGRSFDNFFNEAR